MDKKEAKQVLKAKVDERLDGFLREIATWNKIVNTDGVVNSVQHLKLLEAVNGLAAKLKLTREKTALLDVATEPNSIQPAS